MFREHIAVQQKLGPSPSRFPPEMGLSPAFRLHLQVRCAAAKWAFDSGIT
jgi:hypothetical protein